ncbi:MAG: hypothetical protein ABSG32_05300 [Terriglobia bacterium]|jgi:hypothetical protein
MTDPACTSKSMGETQPSEAPPSTRQALTLPMPACNEEEIIAAAVVGGLRILRIDNSLPWQFRSGDHGTFIRSEVWHVDARQSCCL